MKTIMKPNIGITVSPRHIKGIIGFKNSDKKLLLKVKPQEQILKINQHYFKEPEE
jgi:hypothetical protein